MDAIGSNIFASVIATIVIAAGGWILSILLRLPFIFRRRKRLFSFFGITREIPRLVVYLSTVFVSSGGSRDFRGTARTFAGPAVPAAELSAIEPFGEPFAEPVLDSFPSFMRNWLGNRIHWRFRSIAPFIVASPQATSDVEAGNIVTVGSQYYNSAGDLYTETGNPILRMEQVGPAMTIRVARGPRANDVFQARSGHQDDLAIVEKLRDASTNSTVFVAAGLGVVGTRGAVQYIVDNWEALFREFGERPFAICLRFQQVRDDPNSFRRPNELSRFCMD